MSDMQVHPVADLFPMLADDELAELAEDIRQRGLLQPIVLDAEGRVLDGRNRLAACELVGVEPEFTTYNGDDPDGYALAANGQRRAQTKGQKALVAAAYLNDLRRAKTQRSVARALGVTEALVSQAVLIHSYARELGEAVMASGSGFADALREATERKRNAEEAQAKLDRLRECAPDLLALVDEERMSLDDATGALDAREEQARQEEARQRSEEDERRRREAEAARQANTKLADAINYLSASTTSEWRALTAEQWRTGACDASPPARESVHPDNLRAIADGLHKLADQMKE